MVPRLRPQAGHFAGQYLGFCGIVRRSGRLQQALVFYPRLLNLV